MKEIFKTAIMFPGRDKLLSPGLFIPTSGPFAMNETLRKFSAKNHRVESDFHELSTKDQSKTIVLLPSGLFTHLPKG